MDNTSDPYLDHSTIPAIFPLANGYYDDSRYYAGICLPYPHEPTQDKFQIITTEEMGQGIISLVDFKVGDIVFVFTGEVLTYQTLTTLQIRHGQYVSDPIFMGKVLHSCDPNMACNVRKRTYTARKPIRAFEFLTMDYESTEDELFRSFYCCCGSTHCRGEIRGKKFKTLRRNLR